MSPVPAPLFPGHLPVVGNLYSMRTAPLASLTRALRGGHDTWRMEFPGGHRGHLLLHPDHVKALLVDRAKQVGKDTPGFAALRLVLGNGLVTSEGAFWLRQRRIAQPAFHRAKILALGERMVALTKHTAVEWAAAAKEGRPVDVAEAMMRLTLRVVADTLLGVDVEREAAGVGRAIAFLLRGMNDRIVRPWAPPLTWPTPGNQRFLAARDELVRVTDDAIARKRAAPDAPGGDLLRMLMEARDEESGEAMTDQQLRDEVVTIFGAGHETTANLLAWTWSWLSRMPHVRRRLREELDAVLGERDATADDYARLPYTRAVLSEALRLTPVVWFISRRVLEDIPLGAHTLRAGSLAFLSPYATHRHPDFWENPEGFDPERFLDGSEKTRPTLAYFPFGAGPRKCIGDTFALVEATLVLATLARRFDLSLPPGQVPVPEPVITLRPKGGLPMHVREGERCRSSG